MLVIADFTSHELTYQSSRLPTPRADYKHGGGNRWLDDDGRDGAELFRAATDHARLGREVKDVGAMANHYCR
jgi:hypothetical protein